MLRYFVACPLLVLVLAAFCASQDPLSDRQAWGPWRSLGPVAPYIEWQVTCDFSAQDASGNWYSVWSYRFRSHYKQQMDLVYDMQYGDMSSGNNDWMGKFLITLEPGKNRTVKDDTDGGTDLFGRCSQHTLTNHPLHAKPICVVPTGQDAPCFPGCQNDECKSSYIFRATLVR